MMWCFMDSIILDLQNELIKSKCDVLQVLRKAHLIADKLKMDEFNKWILNELNGYHNNDRLPKYRIVKGELKFWNPVYGWQPVIIKDVKTENAICKEKFYQPISEIISLCQDNDKILKVTFAGNMQNALNDWLKPISRTHYALLLSVASVKSIIDRVVNNVLDWTLQLERKGILGENMMFNERERECAKDIHSTIINYYGDTNIINGNIDKSHFVTGNNNNISFVSYDVSKLIDDIKNSISNEKLSDEDRSTAMEIIADIDEKVCNQKSSGIIKSSLIGLANFLKDIGANTTAMLIFDKIKDCF